MATSRLGISRAAGPLALVLSATLLMSGVALASAHDEDARIEAAFRNTHVFQTYLKDEAIKIRSIDGVVTLSGTVSSEDDREIAEKTAEALPGVKRVDNRIETLGDRPEERSDAWVQMKVKTALLYHRNVPGMGTEVDVKDGVVTLKGEAESQAQKELTTQYTQDIVGVQKVNNLMVVNPATRKPERTLGAKIDDASITAQVKTMLLLHRSTEGLKTTVKTRNGVVVLTGGAKSLAEKDLATEIASDVDGVQSVVNEMTVDRD